jgi:hypothetical protein
MSHSSPNPGNLKGVCVWGSGGRICAGIRVGARKVYIGRFATKEEAQASAEAGATLRDARRDAGRPLTLAELRGETASGPDLFQPDEARQSLRREKMTERRFRLWAAMHAELARSIVAGLVRRRRNRETPPAPSSEQGKEDQAEGGASRHAPVTQAA